MYLSEKKMNELDSYYGFGTFPKDRDVKTLRDYLTRVNAAAGTTENVNVPREELEKNIRAALRKAYVSMEAEKSSP
jgi:hypothetical protein